MLFLFLILMKIECDFIYYDIIFFILEFEIVNGNIEFKLFDLNDIKVYVMIKLFKEYLEDEVFKIFFDKIILCVDEEILCFEFKLK